MITGFLSNDPERGVVLECGIHFCTLFLRLTLPLHYWEDLPGILAGRDIAMGGTWLALSTDGRLACVTNYRQVR